MCLAHSAAHQARFTPRKVESVTLLLAYHGHDALLAGYYAQLHKYGHHNAGVGLVAVIEFDAVLPSYLEAETGADVEVAVDLPYVAAMVAEEVPALAVARKAEDAAYLIGSNVAALVQTFRFGLAVAEGIDAGRVWHYLAAEAVLLGVGEGEDAAGYDGEDRFHTLGLRYAEYTKKWTGWDDKQMQRGCPKIGLPPKTANPTLL